MCAGRWVQVPFQSRLCVSDFIPRTLTTCLLELMRYLLFANACCYHCDHCAVSLFIICYILCQGTILHKTRYGRRPIPSQYQSHTETHCPCDVTSLSFSPWQPDYFLAGYSNGSIALYHTARGRAVLVGLSSSSFSNAVAHPLVTWSESTNGIAVRQVEWVWHRPGVFLVLDSDSTLYWW